MSHTSYNDETWHSYTLPKVSEYMNHVRYPLSSAGISIFSRGNQHILLYQKVQIETAFWCIISNYFNFFWVFKDFFNKNGYYLMMSAKMATLGLFKANLFWNKGYDIIIYVHDVNKKSYHVTQIIL